MQNFDAFGKRRQVRMTLVIAAHGSTSSATLLRRSVGDQEAILLEDKSSSSDVTARGLGRDST